MVDMMNHNTEHEVTWGYDDKRQGFVASAIKDIKRGQQIYDTYGAKPNTAFLLNYGFLLEQNDENIAYF